MIFRHTAAVLLLGFVQAFGSDLGQPRIPFANFNFPTTLPTLSPSVSPREITFHEDLGLEISHALSQKSSIATHTLSQKSSIAPTVRPASGSGNSDYSTPPPPHPHSTPAAIRIAQPVSNWEMQNNKITIRPNNPDVKNAENLGSQRDASNMAIPLYNSASSISRFACDSAVASASNSTYSSLEINLKEPVCALHIS